MEMCRQKGAKMVKELVVSGAFHSPLMESAREGLKEALDRTTISDTRIPVCKCHGRTGYPIVGDP